MDTWISFWLDMLPSMLIVSSMLDSISNSGPRTDDVLFNEDFSLALRLKPKIASKSTCEALSSGTTLGPTIRPDLRCMYKIECRVGIKIRLTSVQLSQAKSAVLVKSVNAAPSNAVPVNAAPVNVAPAI